MIRFLSALASAGIRAEVVEPTIDAPPDAVWSVLTDFSAYDEWNPWIMEGGERCRTLTVDGQGTHLRVELIRTGPMVNTVERKYGEAMRSGMAAERSALAERAEATAP